MRTTARPDSFDHTPNNAARGTTANVESWPAILARLLDGGDLTSADTESAMRQVIAGAATSAQLASFVTALRAKGETAAEVSGLVSALRAAASDVIVPGRTVDIAGTGGDRTGAANISTMAAIVAAAAGVTVVKHGGRAASSTTGGAADLVEHLGISPELTPGQAAAVAAKAGITFLFAPQFNPALRHAAAVRRELGVPTVFNVLAPLINPADPHHTVTGVADERMAPIVADVLATRGRRGLVVRGDDGLDKLTTVTTSQIWIVEGGHVTSTRLDPRELGIPRARPADLRGGTPAENAFLAHNVFAGHRGPVRDVVLLNAAAAFVSTASGASFLEDLGSALATCADAVDSGAAQATLAKWIAANATAQSA